MNQKETFNSTVKDHHLNLLVSFNCCDDLVHLRKHLRTEDVERRVVKRDSPILGRALGQMYLSSLCCCVILIFHVCCLLRRASSNFTAVMGSPFMWSCGGPMGKPKSGPEYMVRHR